MLAASLPPIWLPPSSLPPSIQRPILSMTAMAYENSASVWIKWAVRRPDLCQNHFPRRLHFSIKYHSAQSMSNFVPRHDSLSIHSSALRRGNLYCGPPITAAGSTCQHTCVGFEVAEKHGTLFRTGPTATQGAHHIHSTAGVPITMACYLLFRLDNLQLSLVAVSSEICFIQSLTFAQLIFC